MVPIVLIMQNTITKILMTKFGIPSAVTNFSTSMSVYSKTLSTAFMLISTSVEIRTIQFNCPETWFSMYAYLYGFDKIVLLTKYICQTPKYLAQAWASSTTDRPDHGSSFTLSLCWLFVGLVTTFPISIFLDCCQSMMGSHCRRC